MENLEITKEAKQTPMGHIWLIVLTSMCFTFGVSWIWHLSEMRTEDRRNKVKDQPIVESIEEITKYRDTLKESGKDAAAALLATSSLNIYGNSRK